MEKKSCDTDNCDEDWEEMEDKLGENKEALISFNTNDEHYAGQEANKNDCKNNNKQNIRLMEMNKHLSIADNANVDHDKENDKSQS